MLTSRSIIRALIVVSALVPAGRAMAQRDTDADWLEDCRSGSGDRYGRREVYCDVQVTGVRAPRGTVSLEGLRNGGVDVRGWDRDSMSIHTRIRVTARNRSDAESAAKQIRVSIRGAEVFVDGPRHDDDDVQWSASIYADIPRKSDLRAETRNGPVLVEDVRGDIAVQSSNGPLALRNLAGSVNARTTNGPLSITLTGDRWEGSGLEARTTNGPLTISIPDGYNARLEAGTTNGPVSLGFPITVVGRITRDISTTLGSGGATIRATTTNGPLSIKRK